MGKNAYRYVNAVSDFATHARPLRERASEKPIKEKQAVTVQERYAVHLALQKQ